jgi:hypothetical protein
LRTDPTSRSGRRSSHCVSALKRILTLCCMIRFLGAAVVTTKKVAKIRRSRWTVSSASPGERVTSPRS